MLWPGWGHPNVLSVVGVSTHQPCHPLTEGCPEAITVSPALRPCTPNAHGAGATLSPCTVTGAQHHPCALSAGHVVSLVLLLLPLRSLVKLYLHLLTGLLLSAGHALAR